MNLNENTDLFFSPPPDMNWILSTLSILHLFLYIIVQLIVVNINTFYNLCSFCLFHQCINTLSNYLCNKMKMCSNVYIFSLFYTFNLFEKWRRWLKTQIHLNELKWKDSWQDGWKNDYDWIEISNALSVEV